MQERETIQVTTSSNGDLLRAIHENSGLELVCFAELVCLVGEVYLAGLICLAGQVCLTGLVGG